jgi:hypothetical protein
MPLKPRDQCEDHSLPAGENDADDQALVKASRAFAAAVCAEAKRRP